MATTLRTHRLRPFISLTTVMVAALTACGGNSDDEAGTPPVAAPVFPSAGFGQVTALVTGLIETGTYVAPSGAATPGRGSSAKDATGQQPWALHRKPLAGADADAYSASIDKPTAPHQEPPCTPRKPSAPAAKRHPHSPWP